MTNVRMAILDNNGDLVTFLDNSIPNGNKYYNDELTEYLKGGKASKLTLYAIKNGTLSEALIVGNKLSFEYNEQDYYFNIMYTESDETYIKTEAYSLNFELLNEEKTKYEATESKTFEEYVDVFDFENVITIGLNEVSNLSMQLTFSGSESMLARLFSLADYFSAELEFLPVLNDDYSLSELILNVYKEHDDDYQGVGEDRTGKTLHLGAEIYTVEKSVDLTDLYTAIWIENNDGLNLSGYEANEYDDNGVLEYYTSSSEPFIRAPQARDLFPSNLLGSSDRYIVQYADFDCGTQAELYAEGLRLLKINSTPKATYEIKGGIDANVGDTILVDDADFKPRLILEARVSEKVTSFTNPQNNQLTFTNVEEFDSEISSTLTALVTAAQATATAALQTFEDYTPTATLTDAINASIVDDGKSIATGTVTLASTGLSIASGGLEVQDASEATVLSQDDDGNLVVVGDYTQKGTYGNAVVLEDSKITFYDSEDSTNATSPKNMGEIRAAHIDNEYGDDTEILSVKGNGHVRVLAQDSNNLGTASLQAGDGGLTGAGIYVVADSSGSNSYMQDGNPVITSAAFIQLTYNSSTNVSSVKTTKGCTYGTLTAQNSWDVSGSTLSKNKFGNFVCLNLVAIHSGTTSANNTIGTLPVSYRPTKMLKEITFEASGGQKVELNINTDGTVKTYTALANSSTNYIYANIVFPTET